MCDSTLYTCSVKVAPSLPSTLALIFSFLSSGTSENRLKRLRNGQTVVKQEIMYYTEDCLAFLANVTYT